MINCICECCKRSFYLRFVQNSSELEGLNRMIINDQPFVVKRADINGPRNCHKCQACVKYHVVVQSPVNLLKSTIIENDANKIENFLLEFDQSNMICKMWCPSTSKCVKTIKLDSDNDSLCDYLVIENKKLVTLKRNGFFCVYDLNNGKRLKTFKGNGEHRQKTKIHFV